MNTQLQCFFVVATVGACVEPRTPASVHAVAALPDTVPAPVDNPGSEAKVVLGRALFWDPILSGDRDVACATCHHPDYAYADGRALSIGVGGVGLGPLRVAVGVLHATTLNSMTILDTAWNGLNARDVPTSPEDAPMFWANRAHGLENQASGPMHNIDEMRGTQFTDAAIGFEVAARLEANAEYRAMFDRAFGAVPITEKNITQAIAVFERTLVARNSSFDRYMAGEDAAMNSAQKRGLMEFTARGCTHCHAGPMLSDFQLHTMQADHGLHGGHSGTGMPGGVIRTVSLRNVMRTAPYFQDGSLPTIDDVFNFYMHIDQAADPELAGIDPPMPIAVGARDDLKAFFTAISDGDYDRSVPVTVPSGLPPGGTIR
ncbi:MAG: cytochrome-c peroxidase [Kofleriaceae bacterium]|nr:cytochrome-c peroxidase [Kofleriaceae bacterium]